MRYSGVGSLACAVAILLGADATTSRADEAPVAGDKASPVVVDRVVAHIGDEAITHLEVMDRLKTSQNPVADVIAGGAEGRGGFKAALEDLVSERLILAEARKLDVTASNADVDRHVKSIMEQNGWSQGDFEAAVRMLGFGDVDSYRDHARKELIKSQVLRLKVGARVRVSDREVEDEFNRQYAGGTSEEEVHLHHIAFLISDDVEPDRLREILSSAQEVRQMAVSGARSFEDLAREFGQDGSASRGGDVGWFPRGRLQASLESAAFSLTDGEVSPVVQSSAGFHILRVTERRRVSIRDAEEAKRRIRFELSERVFEQEFLAWVKALRSAGRVTILTENP
jgi:peptidyl-prolyl cis-trans isomerase SurA